MSRSGWPLPRAKDAVECMMSVAFQFLVATPTMATAIDGDDSGF